MSFASKDRFRPSLKSVYLVFISLSCVIELARTSSMLLSSGSKIGLTWLILRYGQIFSFSIVSMMFTVRIFFVDIPYKDEEAPSIHSVLRVFIEIGC